MIFLEVDPLPIQEIDWKTVLGIFFTVGMSLIGYKIKDWYSTWKSNKFKMSTHPIMSRLYRMEQDVLYWKVPDSRVVLRDAFLIVLHIITQQTKEYLHSLDEKNMNKFELARKLNIYVTELVKSYHKEWEEKGIPLPIMQKFDLSYKTKISILHERVDNVCNNDAMYISYKIKAISFFDTVSILLSEMKNECLEMMFMTSFNGDLKGIIYKGIPINDEEYREYLKSKEQ